MCKMELRNIFFFLTLVFLILRIQRIDGIQLNSLAAKYVSDLVVQFTENPTASQFDHVICPPRVGESFDDFFYPKIFIWCPIEHYRLKVNCPIHNCPLKPSYFTDEVGKTSPRNPRFVYDVRGNTLLIQRMYICHHQGSQHRYLSASETILESILPVYGHNSFPILLFHKSACSKELSDFVEMQILQGISFIKICEGLAALNFKEFCERYERFSLVSSLPAPPDDEVYDRFYKNIMYSFPSNDFLMHLFLSQFQYKRLLYENDMKKRALSSRIISCDHTFKVSKFIGARRANDNTFVKQFENLYIALNENHEIIGWRLTKSTAFNEIRSLLEELKNDASVTRIIVDDCCKVKALYESVFSEDVEVKLDLFHAVQRVTKTIPKRTELSKQFSKEFGMIFRANGDCGEVRTMPTPKAEVITENLENFLKRWRMLLDQPEMERTLSEIQKLREHITRGCLSDLNPGEGTESNESIHHILNKSLLCGATTIGPELAMAILALIFYSINCKKRGKKHDRNSRIIPFIPLIKFGAEYSAPSNNYTSDEHVTSEVAEPMQLSGTCDSEYESHVDETNNSILDEIVVISNINDMCNDTVVKLLLNNTKTLHKILENIGKDSNNRSFNAYDVPIMQLSSVGPVLLTDDGVLDTEVNHREVLERNLAAFNLHIDPVTGDGDCAFRSIVLQIRKSHDWNDRESALHNHLLSLELGRDIDNDVFHLRQLFVNSVQSSEHYQMLTGIPLSEMNTETERFRDQGSFCGDVGDLVIKVCSDILRTPIIVVTSINGAHYVPFIPDDAVTERAIYLGYNAFGPGHYDGTEKNNPISVLNAEKSNFKACSCGKNNANGEKESCVKDSNRQSRCPCVNSGKSCSRDCRCKGCKNNTATNRFLTTDPGNIVNLSCKCGQNKSKEGKYKEFVSCKDGSRKSKCPCLRVSQQCGKDCACVNCGNPNGKKTYVGDGHDNTNLNKQTQKRKRKSPSTYKKKRSSDYLVSQGIDPLHGPWTTYETCLLYCVLSLIGGTEVSGTLDAVTCLFNHVVDSKICKESNFALNRKKQTQVYAKLNVLQEKQDIRRLLYN